MLVESKASTLLCCQAFLLKDFTKPHNQLSYLLLVNQVMYS